MKKAWNLEYLHVSPFFLLQIDLGRYLFIEVLQKHDDWTMEVENDHLLERIKFPTTKNE